MSGGSPVWSRRHVLLLSGVSAATGACAVARRGSSGSGAQDEPAAPVGAGDQPTGTPSSTVDPAALPLLWSAEFDGSAGGRLDPAEWTVRTGAGGWGNQELQCYTDEPENASLDGRGALALTMLRRDVVDADGNSARFTSGRVETVRAFPARRIEARARIPLGIGLWAAVWTVGDDGSQAGWPRCGEIDLVEHYDTAEEVEVVGHGAELDAGGATREGRGWSRSERVAVPDLAEGFHVYAVDLATDELVFSVDGAVRAVVRRDDLDADDDWPFDRPQRVVVDLAMSRWLGDQLPPLPASLLVDWVRVYGPAE